MDKEASAGRAGKPGQLVLMGSGETAPAAQKVFHRVFAAIADDGDGVRMAVLETPAGFEPNSGYVAEQIMRFVQKRLQNFAPALFAVPARKRGSPFSTDDPALAERLHDANVLFMGPGSPTYAVRQLRRSLIWETLRACHRLGAALILSSAATLAASRWTLPVYEIYKAGADLYWETGLDLLGDFGLNLVLVPHWNNADGGSVLDTSRCYLGQVRFDELAALLPAGQATPTLLGIDESTALALDFGRGVCTVIGIGAVTVIRGGRSTCYAAGEQFATGELGDFALPPGLAGVDAAAGQAVLAGRSTAAMARAAAPAVDPVVHALLAEREVARSSRSWADADRLRDRIAALGWRVLDTGSGQRIEPIRSD
jgi:hypothetical protein